MDSDLNAVISAEAADGHYDGGWPVVDETALQSIDVQSLLIEAEMLRSENRPHGAAEEAWKGHDEGGLPQLMLDILLPHDLLGAEHEAVGVVVPQEDERRDSLRHSEKELSPDAAKSSREDELITDHTNQYLCDVCGRVWGTLSQLKNHMLVHTAENKHMCMICPAAFASVEQLVDHLRQHVCTVCSCIFRTPSEFKKHICLKEFSNRSSSITSTTAR